MTDPIKRNQEKASSSSNTEPKKKKNNHSFRRGRSLCFSFSSCFLLLCTSTEKTHSLLWGLYSTLGPTELVHQWVLHGPLNNPAIQGQAPARIVDIPPEPRPMDTRKYLITLGHWPEASPLLWCYGTNLKHPLANHWLPIGHIKPGAQS